MASDIKGIKITIYLFTEDIKEKKKAWEDGYVYIPANERHGIMAGDNEYFKNLNEIPAAIRKALSKQRIQLL